MGASLLTLAARQGRQLRFEAAVGGAMPIVRAIGDGLAGDRITRIVAILNGTTNAVLSRMEATGCSLADALADARARGFAESDPSADLDGDDAAAKLAILCALAFGLRVDPSQIDTRSSRRSRRTTSHAARADGGTIRQIAHAEYDRDTSTLTAWVAPVVVPRGSIFASATGAQNAALITGEHSGETGIFGTGAGGDATAVAILSDLAAIARDRAAIVPAPASSDRPDSFCGLHDVQTQNSQSMIMYFGGLCRPSSLCGGRVSALIGLQCHLCKTPFPAEAIYVCDQLPRPARAGLRLPRHSRHPRRDRAAAEEPVALPRAAADHRRAAHRLPLGLHAARALRPPRASGSASASCTSRTTR